jgi:hypothetical protein
MLGDFPIFVLDIVTIVLFVVLAGQSYFIIQLAKKIGDQNKELAELKEVVYALFDASKKKGTAEYHNLSANGK